MESVISGLRLIRVMENKAKEIMGRWQSMTGVCLIWSARTSSFVCLENWIRCCNFLGLYQLIAWKGSKGIVTCTIYSWRHHGRTTCIFAEAGLNFRFCLYFGNVKWQVWKMSFAFEVLALMISYLNFLSLSTINEDCILPAFLQSL